jgi:hypothetical protein
MMEEGEEGNLGWGLNEKPDAEEVSDASETGEGIPVEYGGYGKAWAEVRAEVG